MRIGKLIAILIIFSIFAGNAGASFLDDEAGISAYTKANTAINLNNAKNAFRTIERQTSNYIIGSVPIPGLPETEDAHVYVNSSGWILAYYLKDVPVSKIVQWSGYSGGTVTTTTLEDSISSVATAAGVSYSNTPVKYYDFKYPGANRLMIIVDWKETSDDSYDFNVPKTFVLNENSYSLRSSYSAWHKIDGNDIPIPAWSYILPNVYVIYGYYSSILSQGAFHTITYDVVSPGGHSTVLVYQEP